MSRAKNERRDKFLEGLRERGHLLRLNWRAGRWKGDQGCVEHYSITDSATGLKPSIRTFVLIDYGSNGYGLYTEAPSAMIDHDVALICGTGHAEG